MVIKNKKSEIFSSFAENIKLNKKGWTTIIEVFISILLLASLVTVILNSEVVQEKTKSEDIYKEQVLVLKIIQLNDSLRQNVLDDTLSIGINNTIDNTIPDYLKCEAKICVLNSKCDLNSLPSETENKEIYVKTVLITTNNTDYNPKEFKLFCWEK